MLERFGRGPGVFTNQSINWGVSVVRSGLVGVDDCAWYCRSRRKGKKKRTKENPDLARVV